MFPCPSLTSRASATIPRVSGGVSNSCDGDAGHWDYSPRQRGCFRKLNFPRKLWVLFPASAGVFPKSAHSCINTRPIPRVSGGVSGIVGSSSAKSDYSPRQRGCFPRRLPVDLRPRLFPASAGVFPSTTISRTGSPTIPRVSGGVSVFLCVRKSHEYYSPRQRGCFHVLLCGRFIEALFPASAGVFPLFRARTLLQATIPRVSGGVSGFSARPLRSPNYSPRQRGCFPKHGRRQGA